MKQIFTNIDLSGNAIFNLVIGSFAEDPVGVGYGFVYRNSQTGRLRVYTNNGWEDLIHTPNGKIVQVVTSFEGIQGRGDTLYLKLRNGSDNTYNAYVYVDNSFCQISGHSVHWSEIVGKPNILDCSYIGNEELSIRYTNES
jgi:hypothetical protein